MLAFDGRPEVVTVEEGGDGAMVTSDEYSQLSSAASYVPAAIANLHCGRIDSLCLESSSGQSTVVSGIGHFLPGLRFCPTFALQD